MRQAGRDFPATALRAIAAAVSLLGIMLVPQAHAETTKLLRIGGTGCALGGMRLLADAFTKAHPDIQIAVLPSLGSSGGIRAILADKIDVSVSAELPKDPAQAGRLVAGEYARTPFVFATHRGTSASDVTLEQVAQVYAGTIRAWPDGTRLRLIMRPAVEADTKFLRTLSAEMDKAVEAATMQQDLHVSTTDQDNASALENIRGSLGLITLAQILSEKRHLKPLAIDGLRGTLEALQEGKYPYAKHLFLITKPQPAPAVESFLEFVRSPEGQRILAASGHLVTTAKAKSGM